MSEEAMTRDEMLKYEIEYYINLIRIKKVSKELNEELEYQLKVQKNKLATMGVNTTDYEYN